MTPLCFIAAGNYSQMVSYPAWLHCVSSRQETFRVQFPIRHDAIVFHRGRKLFANGFLSGMAPLRFIPAGNFSRMVSYPTWYHCVSCRQETFREWFPIRHGSIAFHRGRKLFTNGFLSGMAPLRFISTGNYSTGDFSTPLRSARNDRTACHHRVSSQQETLREWFPIRHGSTVFHRGRKLFAYSFPSDMMLSCFIAAGNFSRMVSYPAWLHCVSSRQETFCDWFPIRHGSIAFHTDRKLFTNSFPSGIAPLPFISIGNFPQSVYNSKQTTAAAHG